MKSLSLICFCATFLVCSRPLFADGQLGDIIYSYLPESQFQEVHGDGWINMSTQNNIANTELCTRFSICSLPKAAGTFVRISGGNSARVGLVQDYATALPGKSFKGISNLNSGHTHSETVERMGYYSNPNASSFTFNPGGHSSFSMTKQLSTAEGAHEHTIEVTKGGDNETRPVNIAFNAYIKVNQGTRGTAFEEMIKRTIVAWTTTFTTFKNTFEELTDRLN